MNKRWILPVALILILVGLFAFRWDYKASKTYNGGVVKWKTDRWTGRVWMEVYSLGDNGPIAFERLASPLPVEGEIYARHERGVLTWIWSDGVILCATWLLIIFKGILPKTRKKPAYIILTIIAFVITVSFLDVSYEFAAFQVVFYAIIIAFIIRAMPENPKKPEIKSE